MKREVTDCGDCPFLYQNSEYPDSYCNLANRNWGMGYYSGGPAPPWCPLKKEDALVTLKIKDAT